MNNIATDRGRPNQRFRPHERLRREADFERVFAARRSAGDALMTVHVAANNLEWSRLAVSVPKRIGNAVERHYARRRIRETFRRNKAALPKGLDIVCVARARAADRQADILESLLTLVATAASRAPSGSARIPRSCPSKDRRPSE